MIKVNSVHKYFNYKKRNEIHVLNDITLDFPSKGLVVLLGASGSGKTTLLNVISGLDKIDKGNIVFDNVVLSRYRTKKWDFIRNEKIGYVFQNYYLLPQLSVFDNIAFVLKMLGITDPQVIEQRVNYILKAVNMYPFRKKRALQLSGGQQQRVAIARALVKNPNLVIADEPTGNLDSKNTIDIMNIIKEISKEKLVILVTHEKEIAHFYGDRIIEIKDGKIIKDYLNTESEDYRFHSGEYIYLKDLHQVDEYTNNGIKFSYYTDEEDDENLLSVRLIQKNKTLYIDVSSNNKKQVLVNENTGVIIKDEHYVKKTREQITETSFNLEQLSNGKVKRERPIIISIKQIIEMAFLKVAKLSRKGKLMMFSFAVAGAIIAISIAIIINALTIRPEQSMMISKGYVAVHSVDYNEYLSSYLSYEDLLKIGVDDEEFYINTQNVKSLIFKREHGLLESFRLSGRYEPYDFITKKDLIYGRLPTAKNEILITRVIADNFIRYRGQEYGIWNYKHLLNEKISYKLADIKIVGIVDSDISIIYMSESLGLSINNFLASADFAPELVEGRMPNDGEVLISERQYQNMTEEEIEQLKYPISGVYAGTYEVDYVFMTTNFLKKIHYENAYEVHIRSKNPSELVEKLSENDRLVAKDVYQEAYNRTKSENKTVILSTVTASSILLLFALFGFYFLIRSSLISRIYEISIFRALGVQKRNIFRSFTIEIIIITSISSLVGFILMMFVLGKIQKSLGHELYLFSTSFHTIIIGIAITYGLNLIAGLLPVHFLLRKTPAQILTQYDI